MKTGKTFPFSQQGAGSPEEGPRTVIYKEYTAVIKEATRLISPISENIPEELTERPQWVLWRLEMRDDILTKVPYTPRTFLKASSTNLMTWGSFKDTLAAYRASEGLYSGVGFMFSSADPFVGIDLDDCRDPETGDLAPWAQKIIDRVQEGYIEASPSGTGVHIIVEGMVRGGGMRKGPIEMYSRERFFTITGEIL
jgi:putative DNA primase/helicase